jgi:hypothetical protein
MPRQQLMTYFIQSAIGGGALGAIHGAIIMHKHNLTIEPIITHGATGLFLGPWAPVALPIWMWKYSGPCTANPSKLLR